jgi:hypothetical protein
MELDFMIERSLHNYCLPALVPALPWPRCYFRLVLIQFVIVIVRNQDPPSTTVIVVVLDWERPLTNLPTYLLPHNFLTPGTLGLGLMSGIRLTRVYVGCVSLLTGLGVRVLVVATAACCCCREVTSRKG